MNINNVKKTLNELDGDITLVAVTKNQSINDVKELELLGVNNFGENKLQELIKKKEYFPNANWHFIGRIQSNKIKDMVHNCVLIHSVASIKHLSKINLEASKINIVQDILVQINIANDPNKDGLSQLELDELIANQNDYLHIRVRGMMVIGDHTDDINKISTTFATANVLFKELQQQFTNFDILSMGMSNDYKLAIQQGSNCVRVGSLLFK